MTARRARVEALGGDDGPPLGPFARDLRTGEGEATAFLPPMPRDDAGWLSWIERAAATGPVSAAFAEKLAARQEALGAGEAAGANARALATPGTVAVVTGQQPGLVGGPLLTAHKVAGAVNLARRLDGLGGHRVVPVFWSASEDHDFDEANRTTFIDRKGLPQNFRVAAEGDGRSIVDLPVDRAAMAEVASFLQRTLPDTDRARAAAKAAAPGADDDFATASVRALLALFGDSGLVVVEPEAFWPESGATLATLVDRADDITDAVRSAGAELRQAGLTAPLDPEPASAPVFYREAPGGPRLRVSLDGDDHVLLRGERSALDRASLSALLQAQPERGSGNVVGRVLVQNRHLPVLAYVAGPTEIAYQAQVRWAAEALGWYFPLALPRPEATWVDPKTTRALSALGLSVPEVLSGAEPEASADTSVRDALSAARQHLDEWPPTMHALVERGGRTGAAAQRAMERAGQAFGKHTAAIEKAAQDDAGVGRSRFERVLAMLLPFARRQERVLSPWNLAARYGIEAVRDGLSSLDPLEPAHFLVFVGEENHDA